jgi:hypothetical protein
MDFTNIIMMFLLPSLLDKLGGFLDRFGLTGSGGGAGSGSQNFSEDPEILRLQVQLAENQANANSAIADLAKFGGFTALGAAGGFVVGGPPGAVIGGIVGVGAYLVENYVTP